MVPLTGISTFPTRCTRIDYHSTLMPAVRTPTTQLRHPRTITTPHAMERTMESKVGQFQRTQRHCGGHRGAFTQQGAAAIHTATNTPAPPDNYPTLPPCPHPAPACRLSSADYHSQRLRPRTGRPRTGRPRTERRGREQNSGPGCTALRGWLHAPLTHAPRNKRRSHWPGRVSPRHSARGAVFRLPRHPARGGVFRPRCLARPRTLIGGPPRPAY